MRARRSAWQGKRRATLRSASPAGRESKLVQGRGRRMALKKTRQEREAELRQLMATPAGRGELEQLASAYSAKGGRPLVAGKSVITFILVYEREIGLIEG